MLRQSEHLQFRRRQAFVIFSFIVILCIDFSSADNPKNNDESLNGVDKEGKPVASDSNHWAAQSDAAQSDAAQSDAVQSEALASNHGAAQSDAVQSDSISYSYVDQGNPYYRSANYYNSG
nr:uncharacterized protein LOC106620463 isoform X1 [Bactrocera oleae]